MYHVYLTVPAVGHMTCLHNLFPRMLELEPELRIISIIHQLGVPTANKLLQGCPDSVRQRLDLRSFGNEDMFGSFPQVVQGFFEAVQEAKDKELRLVGMDQFGTFDLLPKVREVAPNAKVAMTWTGAANSLWSFLAPFADGGFADYAKRAQELSKENGEDENKIAVQLAVTKNGFTDFRGVVLKTPDHPKGLYDYEREHVNAPQMPGVEEAMLKMVQLGASVDVVINHGSVCFEPEAVKAYKRITDVFAVGFQTHETVWQRQAKLEDRALLAFLDKQKKQSVVYISFGSFIGPDSTPRLVGILVDVLVSLGRPFVLNCQSDRQKAAITKEGLEKAEKYANAFVAKQWVDQGALLSHSSVGWFLSHCGMNSVVEAIATGVPIIAWPIANDGLGSAAILSTRPKPVAFELLQIRQGPARARPMRGDIQIAGSDDAVAKEMREIIEACFGAKGDQLRKNMAELNRQCREEQQGRAKEEIRRLATL